MLVKRDDTNGLNANNQLQRLSDKRNPVATGRLLANHTLLFDVIFQNV